MIDKVKFYLDNGVFREVKNPFGDKKMKELEELENIWGVGAVKAQELHRKGYKTVKSLRNAQAAGTEIPLTKL